MLEMIQTTICTDFYEIEPDNIVTAFRGINGCKHLRAISRGKVAAVFLIKMINLEPGNQGAALKVFKYYSTRQNKLECQREKAILENIAMHESKTGEELQIAHIRDDIDGVHCPNLMLEHIHGFDLTDKRLKRYSFSVLVHFVKHLIDQIGNGVLRGLHSMNIYHNDLKPANIMFDPVKQLFYLIDFGLAIPLSLMHESVFIDANLFTTLKYMSPWHLKLVRLQRRIYNRTYHTLNKHKMLNCNETRSYAAYADFYSFGLTTIRVLGVYCNGSDALCLMAKEIVSLQDKHFADVNEQDFIYWKADRLEQLFVPYWKKIRVIMTDYIRESADSISDSFMTTVAEWLQFF